MKTIVLDVKQAIVGFEALLDTHLGDERKEKIYTMLFEKGVSKRLYNAPASNSLDYHCAFDGGLVVHSLSVMKILLKMNDILEIRCSNGMESLVLVGAFHDLGKIGDDDGQYYLPEEEEWWRGKRGRMYNYNRGIQQMPHSLRSLYILQQFGIILTVDEFFAIHYHDGMYINQGQDIKYRETSLQKALHFADIWSYHELEQRKDPNNWSKDSRPW